MEPSRIFRRGALAATVAALLTASPAMAVTGLGAAPVACRAAIAKNYPKLVSTAVKAIAACHKSRDTIKVPSSTDCNNLSGTPILVDPKGKFAAAASKYVTAIDTACGTTSDAILAAPPATVGNDKQYYVSCPVSCPGVTNPMLTMHQVAVCQGCEAAAVAGAVSLTTLGDPTISGAGLAKADAACHGAIAKGYGKFLAAGLKEHTTCQTAADKVGTNTLDGCANEDVKGKVQKAKDAAAAGIVKSCTAATLSNLDGCATDNTTNLTTCTAAAWTSASSTAFTAHYEMEGNLCPSTIRTTIRGGCSVNGSVAGTCTSGFQTGTQLSVGWKGLGHGIDVTDNYTLGGNVDCHGATSKGSCGSCDITGISYDNPQYSDFTRCADDPATLCTHPFTTDNLCGNHCLGGTAPHNVCTTNTDCSGGNTCTTGQCRYYLGPPLAISAGGTPTCTLNVISSNITGTANPDDGTSDLLVNLRSVVHSGESQSRPCPICRGDLVAQDGNKDGHCLGGAHDGDTCDVQGFDLSFAPTDATNPTSGNSLDCPPNAGANISGQGLAIALPLTTGTATKTAVDACESPLGNLSCFCGACSLDPTISCEQDTDCSSIGKGTCGSAASSGGSDRKPNLCGDGICTALPGQTDRGQCLGHAGSQCTFGSNDGTTCATNVDCTGGGRCKATTGADFDNYCDGLSTASGHGVLTCNSDADCDNYVCTGPQCTNHDNWVCPGNVCGTCSAAAFRSCFLDPIAITGTPDTKNPILVGTFCLPPSTSSTVNLATGTPGPGVVQTDSLIQLRY